MLVCGTANRELYCHNTGKASGIQGGRPFNFKVQSYHHLMGSTINDLGVEEKSETIF